jgi:hypothetical protein
MHIEPRYLALNHLLQGRLFRIPDYQRAYSWETKHRADLFEDIRRVIDGNGADHFMATVVCLDVQHKTNVGVDEYCLFDVVDGQQRLTTLLVLLKAIEKSLSATKDPKAQEEGSRIRSLLVKKDKQLLLLQANHQSAAAFREYLEVGRRPSPKVTTAAEQNLARACQECERFVADCGSTANAHLQLLRTVLNRLTFIFYALDDEAAVYGTFEVLNSRGRPVDWLDKCKTVVMGAGFEGLSKQAFVAHAHELRDAWSDIYAAIGVRDVPGDEILRFAATLKSEEEERRRLSSEDSLELFRDACRKKPASTVAVSRWIVRVAEALKELYLDARLRSVTEISQARLLAVAIKLAPKWTDAEKEKALAVWEKVTFRIFGLCDKDARQKVGEYTRLAQRIVRGFKIGAAIQEIGFLGADPEFSISRAVKQLKGRDCYNDWGPSLRYFLYRYEEHLASEAGVSVDDAVWRQIWASDVSSTVEHIRPQKWNAVGWTGVLGRNKKEVDARVGRLGNLMLLPPGVNSRAKDHPFAEKRTIYEKHGALQQVREVASHKKWTDRYVERREKAMISWAKKALS